MNIARNSLDVLHSVTRFASLYVDTLQKPRMKKNFSFRPKIFFRSGLTDRKRVVLEVYKMYETYETDRSTTTGAFVLVRHPF